MYIGALGVTLKVALEGEEKEELAKSQLYPVS